MSKTEKRGYVVSRGGTFGVVHRTYNNEEGRAMVLIRWGSMGLLTPVFERDVKYLSSSYESEARKEAEEWMCEIERMLAHV